MSALEIVNNIVGGLGLVAAAVGVIKTMTARHSLTPYGAAGVILTAGGVLRFATTDQPAIASAELGLGVTLLFFFFSARGGISIR